MKAPDFIYDWIDERGSVPFWGRLIWPTLHFCCEWDYLLIDKTMREYECCRCYKESKQ